MPLSAGTRLGPYEILGLMGAGGMGEVYRANDPRLGRHVALKILTGEFASDETRKRLLHEARAAAKLSHSSVASIYDVLECEGQLCLVMEFVEGETLVPRFARGPWSAGELLPLIEELLDGLTHAHRHGIIHRDLKPANLMITPEGRLKILDFGIARIRPKRTHPEASGGDTERYEIAGSPGYAAPEQLLSGEADARSDLYSVGVLMFRALTGRLPFEATDLIGSLVVPMTDEAPNVYALNDRVPPDVSEIVARALRPNPADRFGSAQEMLDAVRRTRGALSERPTFLVNGAARQFGRPFWRRGAWAMVVTIALAVSAPSLYRHWFQPIQIAEHPIVAVLPLETLGGNAGMNWLGAGVAETVGMSLSKVKAVTVISRSDVVEAMRRTKESGKIARQVGATLLVDGSIQESQNRVRATVRLVRLDGTVMWSEAYEAPSDAVFALQTDVAAALSKQLRLATTAGERDRMAQPPTTNGEALKEYWKGQAALELATLVSNVQIAIDSFTGAVTLDPNFAAAYAALANAYWQYYGETHDASLTSRATEAAMKALSLDPDQPSVRISLATIYAGTGQYKAAEIELRRALATDDTNDEAFRQLGKVLLQQNRSDEAIAALQRAVAIRPEYWRNYADLGIVCYRVRRLQDAKSALQRAIDLSPDNPAPHNNLGIVYAQLGERAHALAEFERANTLAPTRRGYSNLGMSYYEAGRFDEALQAYRRALTFDTQSDLTHGNIGDVLLRLGRIDDARREYQLARTLGLKLLQVNGKDAGTLSRVAVFEAKLGMSGDALRHARAAIELAPHDPEVNFKLAVVQTKLGQTDAALQTLAHAMQYGYAAAQARDDQDLAPLRGNPKFQGILEERVLRSGGESK